MKIGLNLILMFSLLFNITFAHERMLDDPFVLYEQLSELKEPKAIYQGLIALRNASQDYKKWLQEAKTYQPDEYYFSISIISLLEDLPAEFDDAPPCQYFLEGLLDDYRVQDVQDLEDLEHDIYVIYKKTCN